MADPMLETIITMLRAQRASDGDNFDPIAMRARLESMSSLMPLPEDVVREPVSAGGVPSEWVTAPGARADRVIVYLHGGGYVIGSINTHRDHAGRLSRAAGARVLNVDYRLAPEHPHPAAVDDATAAYRWVLAQGVDASGVAVAGDSAGGGLTVATLVALRDGRVPLPAAGVCLSPWIDLEGVGESMVTKADLDPMVQADGLRKMAALYLGSHHPRTPLAAPLYADLRGLPPLLVQVGTAETLLDDSIRLAERARAADVDVTLEQWEDMIHVFQCFAAMLPEAQQAIERIGEYLRGRWDAVEERRRA